MFKILLFVLSFIPAISNGETLVLKNSSIEKISSNGETMEITYKNGKKEKEIIYKSGKDERIEKNYSPEGFLMTEISFKADKIDGTTKMYDKDGNIIWEIEYERGMKNGLEKRKKKNLFYENHFKNNVLDGKSKIYTQDGVVLDERTYKNGVLEGPVKTLDFFGQLTETNYVDGKEHGTKRTYAREGYLKRESIYENGIKKSEKYFDEYGNIKEMDGVRYDPEGIVKGYYGKRKEKQPKNIQKIERIYDSKNQLEKEIYYYTNGKISAILPYKNNMVTGEIVRYYPNGNVKEKTNYLSFNPHGDEFIFYENGKIHYERKYENGVKVQEKEYDEYGTLIKP